MRNCEAGDGAVFRGKSFPGRVLTAASVLTLKVRYGRGSLSGSDASRLLPEEEANSPSLYCPILLRAALRNTLAFPLIPEV